MTATALSVLPLAMAAPFKMLATWLNPKDRKRYVRALLVCSIVGVLMWAGAFGSAFGDEMFGSGMDYEDEVAAPWMGRALLCTGLILEAMTAGAVVVTLAQKFADHRKKKPSSEFKHAERRSQRLSACICSLRACQSGLRGRAKAMSTGRRAHQSNAAGMYDNFCRWRDWFTGPGGPSLGDSNTPKFPGLPSTPGFDS